MKKILYSLFIIGLLASCEKDEEALTPSNKDQQHPAEEYLLKDKEIVMEVLEKYDTYLLPIFDQKKDFAYNFTANEDFENAQIEFIPDADIDEALINFKEVFFSFYTEEFLKTYSPAKILLCNDLVGQNLVDQKFGDKYEPNTEMSYNATGTTLQFTIANIGSNYEAMTDEEKLVYRLEVNYLFLALYLTDKRDIEGFFPEEFFDFGKDFYDKNFKVLYPENSA